jgi:hypothetical protein
VSTSDRAGFAAAVRSLETGTDAIVLDGIDWDIEASAINVADVVAISKALHRPGWLTSFVPSGGPPVAPYLDAAVQCHKAGLTVRFGQQLYDAPVSQSAALGTVRRAVDAGLPPSCVLVGMMIAADPNHWTHQQCVANLAAIQAVYPSVGGAYLWEAGRAGTAAWAKAMREMLV